MGPCCDLDSFMIMLEEAVINFYQRDIQVALCFIFNTKDFNRPCWPTSPVWKSQICLRSFILLSVSGTCCSARGGCDVCLMENTCTVVRVTRADGQVSLMPRAGGPAP